MSVKTLFTDEIREEMTELNKMELGADDYKVTAGVVNQLTDRLIELEKLELERDKIDIEKTKIEIEQQKADDELYDKKVKNRIAIGTAIGGAVVTVGMALVSLVSEEKGILNTTNVGRKMFDRGINFFFKK